MQQFDVVYLVNTSTRGQQRVTASNSYEAQQLVKAQYAGKNVIILSCNEVR